MPSRKFSAGSGYRYGFNGKENDNEAVQYDYGFRVYDSRLGRFKSVDPLAQSYPYFSPYQFASNSPIANIDLDGMEAKCVITDKFVEDFIKDHNIMNTNWVKDAMEAKQTVIMRLTYATGPDNMDIKDVVLFDGGKDAVIVRLNAETGGRDMYMVKLYTPIFEPSLILTKLSGPVEPITSDNSYTGGLLPRRSPDEEPLKEGIRKGFLTISSRQITQQRQTRTAGAGINLSDLKFKLDDVAFEDESLARNKLTNYLKSLPANTANADILISVQGSRGMSSQYGNGQDLMNARKAKIRSLIPSGLGFPVKVDELGFTPSEAPVMKGFSEVFNTTLTPTNVFEVVRQRVQQKTIGGKLIPGTLQNVGKPIPSTQTVTPEANGTLTWDKK